MTVRRGTREESLRNYTTLDVYSVEKFTALTLRAPPWVHIKILAFEKKPAAGRGTARRALTT